MISDFEARVQQAREANLALYLDDPNPSSARLLMVFEETVSWLRTERKSLDTLSRPAPEQE